MTLITCAPTLTACAADSSSTETVSWSRRPLRLVMELDDVDVDGLLVRGQVGGTDEDVRPRPAPGSGHLARPSPSPIRTPSALWC